MTDALVSLRSSLTRTTDFFEFCGPDYLNLNRNVIDNQELLALAQAAFDIHLLATCDYIDIQSLLNICFCAGSKKRARQLYLQFAYILQTSPWFKDFHAKLESLEKQQRSEKGSALLYNFNGSYLHYKYLNLYVNYCGKSVRHIRGHTMLCAVLDTKNFAHFEPNLICLRLALKTVRMHYANLDAKNIIVPPGRLILL